MDQCHKAPGCTRWHCKPARTPESARHSSTRYGPSGWAKRLPCQIPAPAAAEPATLIDRVQARKLPDGGGAVLAITRALENSGVEPGQIAHVNAHATSTPAGDVLEANAIAVALGDAADGVVVSSTKSITGHLLGGAGAVKSVAAILALHEGMAPPTINLDDPEDDLGVEIAVKLTELPQRGVAPMAVIDNSFGFGGSNVAVIFTAA